MWIYFKQVVKVPKPQEKLIYIKATRTKKLEVGWGVEDKSKCKKEDFETEHRYLGQLDITLHLFFSL